MDSKTKDFLKHLNGLLPNESQTESEHIHCYTFIDL
jgi:hypothetical protein